MAEALENADLAHDVEIFNVIGSSGVEGLYRLLGDTGNSRLLMSMGLGLIGGVIANNADSSLRCSQ
ncbi:TctC citrate transporter [Pseudonocardia sp. Ae406_Ps2]|nr:TctC citrate transporter [Pseudonocardia sp. Ae406_Ps2]